MNNKTFTNPREYLETLVGQPMRYGIKSPGLDLYDFGFGEGEVLVVSEGKAKEKRLPPYILHATCRFKVIWRNKRIVEIYDEEETKEEFAIDVQPMLGHRVKRVALSEKNDLWLDFGVFWIVFVTDEVGDEYYREESWRFFHMFHEDDPHLIGSDQYLKFGDEFFPVGTV